MERILKVVLEVEDRGITAAKDMAAMHTFMCKMSGMQPAEAGYEK